MIKDSSDWNGEFVFDTSKPDGAPKKILDTRKMVNALNWKPQTDINTGISLTVKWSGTDRAYLIKQALLDDAMSRRNMDPLHP